MKTPILKLLTAVVLLAACSSGSDSKSPVVAPAVKVNQPARTDGITFKVERSVTLEEDLSNLESFESGLNIYKVTIRVPAALAQDLKVGKNHQDQNKPSSHPLDSSSFEYDKDGVTISDAIDLNGTSLSLQNFEYEIENSGQELQPLRFSIKPDLIVNTSQKTISELKLQDLRIDVGTLYIDRESSLITEGESISINAETIISNEGTIATLSEEKVAQPADQGFAGKNGGDLKISTNLLVGNINLIMRGQKGGKGIDGAPVTTVKTPGAPGRDSSQGITCIRDLLLIDRTLREEPIDRCRWQCALFPTSGQPGVKGDRGNDAQPGMQGGATGTVEFVATKSKNNKVSLTLIPGAGGDPGTPSQGGPGSLGGAAGAILNERCKIDVRPGENGAQGDPGSPSVPGPAGEQQKSTITLNGKTE